MKKPDLLILVVIWEFFSAFLGIIVIAGFLLYSFYPLSGVNRIAHLPLVFGGIVIAVILAVYVAVAIIAGIGMLSAKEWGRIAGIVHAALNLFLIPLGTILGVLALVYLTQESMHNYFNKDNTTSIQQ